MLIDIFQFTIGCLILYYGAELLIRGSKQLALKFNIPSVIIGITIVALGTSLPELVVSIIANLKDQKGMVIGNVMGSNITNIALVLGVTALYKEIKVLFYKLRYDFYFFIIISILPVLFIFFGGLYFWHGFILIFILISYVIFLINFDRIDDEKEVSEIINFKMVFLKIIFGSG